MEGTYGGQQGDAISPSNANIPSVTQPPIPTCHLEARRKSLPFLSRSNDHKTGSILVNNILPLPPVLKAAQACTVSCPLKMSNQNWVEMLEVGVQKWKRIGARETQAKYRSLVRVNRTVQHLAHRKEGRMCLVRATVPPVCQIGCWTWVKAGACR